MKHKAKILKMIKKVIPWLLLAFFLVTGIFILWATTISLPNLNSFEERKVSQSTKIYDRTGKIILYDVFGEYKRTVVPLDQIAETLKQAAVAVEDKNFYTHNGIEFSSIVRAIKNNILQGNLLGGQGGSTITQQVIKNALLTRDKKISRKLKEWILAPRLEKVLTKDEILAIYLNEIPYGGSVYGIEEASRRFFSKSAKDLTLAESAYLAALPQAPTYYSPYGSHLEQLEYRKNYVLDQMYDSKYITAEQRDSAKSAEVTFSKQESFGIKAPHFVMYIKEQLEKEFGKEVVEQGGLKVITTLDWELQQKAEEIVKAKAFENKKNFNAENAALVAIDPNNGEILTMVGSRDYFDKEIDGNFNITVAKRQPGSTFKPIVYAEAFNKGYRPETVVFDLPTEFSAVCNKTTGENCYTPGNYDDKFRGPMTLRDALAQSINIPAVKMLYLVGVKDALNLAKRMGLETLTNVDQYGLTLVLGGGEVTPLDLAGAYGVFATEGTKYPKKGIIKIEDSKGNILVEESAPVGERIMAEQTTRLISSVLSDNVARTQGYGSNSPLYFGERDVAAKTGTTNDYRDAWILGYTPNIVVAAWAGNNDNSPMEKKVAGMIVAPMWNQFMQVVLPKIPNTSFTEPDPINPDIKPILAGYWKGEKTTAVDGKIKVTGTSGGIHSILHWVDKNDPLGPIPSRPGRDPQYELWEAPVREWAKTNNPSSLDSGSNDEEISAAPKTNHLKILSPEDNKTYFIDSIMVISVSLDNGKKIISGEVFLNSQKIGDLQIPGEAISFYPSELSAIRPTNKLRVIVTDDSGEKYEDYLEFLIK